MKIIIAGAGDVGFHLAKLLSYESQDIYIIDKNTEKLNYVSSKLDVITIKGDATSIKLLKEYKVNEADILLAVTESPEVNFTIAVLGKKLGAKKTIARISNPEFLKNDMVNFVELGIDSIISPEELAANEIKMLVHQSAFNDSIEFENGSLNILGGLLSNTSPLIGLSVQESKNKFNDIEFIIIAIKSADNHQTIIPRGHTVFKVNDQVYFSTNATSFNKLHKLIGKEQHHIKDVMILGGSRVGEKSARNLCHENLNVKLIESKKERAFELAEKYPSILVVHGDGRNVDLLEEENISQMDVFIAVTGNSETNIMSSLVAKSKGVKKTIAMVENMDYINISKTIGIDTLINKKLLAVSSIFKHIRKGNVLALANLHNIDAEVLEFEVNENSIIVNKQIKDLSITSKAVFGGAIRNGKPLMTFGDFQLQPNDKIIVFCLPEAISEVEKLFS
ncbi:MAG: Trk system potassium transporter TrkA [Flavobacteriaceae bacterium]|nr:Trk system potassium transporter TrkA [Flavobacteriaceae bacterium]